LKLAGVVRRLIGVSFREYPPVNDLDSRKSRLEEIADHSGSPAQLMLKIQEFLQHQVPAEEAHRADLKAWAKTELAKLEERTPAGGSTKIGTAPVARAGRRMSMLQMVIREIEPFDAVGVNPS
jgi:hypothetical protein